MNHFAILFWARWQSEHLVMLQKRWKRHFMAREFRVADVVLVLYENLPKNQWALGRVIDTCRGFKDLISKIKLRAKASEIHRPIAKLCLITSEKDALGR